MVVLNKTYNLDRALIKTIAQGLWDDGQKIYAIQFLRNVTGWSLLDSKNYCESGFVDSYFVGDRVKTEWNEVLTVLGVYKGEEGNTYYWCRHDEGSPSTYEAARHRMVSD